MDGDGQWAMHLPLRGGGPQAQSCISCHSGPHANGAGPLAMNVAIDLLQTGDPSVFLECNTLHLFGLGAVHRVAEEMTGDLNTIAQDVRAKACAENALHSAELSAKGVAFGPVTAEPTKIDGSCQAKLDTSEVVGVDHDLVVRAFGWKGTHVSIRDFSRDAAHNEMGMQADELVGAPGVDPLGSPESYQALGDDERTAQIAFLSSLIIVALDADLESAENQ